MGKFDLNVALIHIEKIAKVIFEISIWSAIAVNHVIVYGLNGGYRVHAWIVAPLRYYVGVAIASGIIFAVLYFKNRWGD